MILDKINYNTNYFNTKELAIVYVYSRITGKAEKYLRPRYSSSSTITDPFRTAREIVAYLRTVTVNLYRQREARILYNGLSIENKLFYEFKTTFLHLAGEANIP